MLKVKIVGRKFNELNLDGIDMLKAFKITNAVLHVEHGKIPAITITAISDSTEIEVIKADA